MFPWNGHPHGSRTYLSPSLFLYKGGKFWKTGTGHQGRWFVKKEKNPLFSISFCGRHPWGLGAILALPSYHMCSGQWAVGLSAGADMAAEVEAP